MELHVAAACAYCSLIYAIYAALPDDRLVFITDAAHRRHRA